VTSASQTFGSAGVSCEPDFVADGQDLHGLGLLQKDLKLHGIAASSGLAAKPLTEKKVHTLEDLTSHQGDVSNTYEAKLGLNAVGGSPHPEASLAAKKMASSDSAALMSRALRNLLMRSSPILLCAFVMIVVFFTVALCFVLTRSTSKAGQPYAQSMLSARTPRWEDQPTETWTRTKKEGPADRLLALFRELDEVEQSDDSPPGFITSSDLMDAFEKPYIASEFKDLGVAYADARGVFAQMDIRKRGMVNLEDFIHGCAVLANRKDSRDKPGSFLAHHSPR